MSVPGNRRFNNVDERLLLRGAKAFPSLSDLKGGNLADPAPFSVGLSHLDPVPYWSIASKSTIEAKLGTLPPVAIFATGGIRTHEGISPLGAYQAPPFDHSGTAP